MYEGDRYSSPWVKLRQMSPLFWGIILILLALVLAFLPFRFFRTIAIFPLVVGGLFFYQAIFKNKY